MAARITLEPLNNICFCNFFFHCFLAKTNWKNWQTSLEKLYSYSGIYTLFVHILDLNFLQLSAWVHPKPVFHIWSLRIARLPFCLACLPCTVKDFFPQAASCFFKFSLSSWPWEWPLLSSTCPRIQTHSSLWRQYLAAWRVLTWG